MGYKASVVFNQTVDTRSGGWTMSFHHPNPSIVAVQSRLFDLAGDLNAVTGRDTIATGFKITQDLQPGDPTPRITTAGGYQFFLPGATDVNRSDFPTNAVNLKMRSADGTTVNESLRGIRDGDVNSGGVFNPTSTSVGLYNAVLARLQNDQWSLWVIDRTVPKQPLQGFDSMTGRVFVPGHGFMANNIVRIGRTRLVPGLNNLWRVRQDPASNDHFFLVGWPATTVTLPVYLKPAYAQKQTKGYKGIVYAPGQQITSAFTRSTEHKVGRPSGGFVGRRKKRQ